MAKRTAVTGYKKYTDKAVSELKEEIMSKIDGLDRRDLVQYTNATNVLKDLHSKLEKHLVEEAGEYVKIHAGLAEAATNVKRIQDTLDTVSANGTKGLGPSLKDLYNKNIEVHASVVKLTEVLEPKLERMAWWHSTKRLAGTMPGVRMLSNKFGLGLGVLTLVVIINVVSVAFTGVGLISIETVATIVKWLGKMFI